MAEIKSINGYTIKDETARNTMIYSETPVQIGEWIDGTPIWRQVFDKEITDSDFEDGYVTVMTTTDHVLVLDGTCTAYITSNGYSMYDDVTCPMLTHRHEFSLENISIIQSGYWRVVGWIEFVKAAT